MQNSCGEGGRGIEKGCSMSSSSSTDELLKNTGMLSVNQLAASIKALEVWKSINNVNYPIQLEPNNKVLNNSERLMRPSTCRIWNQDARTGPEKESFSRNAAKIWNMAPKEIKDIKSLPRAKKAIKEWCKRLPT